MKLSKSNPVMKDIFEMDRIFYNFSLLEKLTTGNWVFYVDRSEEIYAWERNWSNGVVQWGEITNSMSWWYLSAYKRLLPEMPLCSDDWWAMYILRANKDELSKMIERVHDEILEMALSRKRWTTIEFLKKLSTKWWLFSGNILKEGIPSMQEFIPLLYENWYDIEMHFSYMENGNDEYEVNVYLSYTLKEVKSVPSASSYLSYDEDSNDIIFSGKRIDMTSAQVDLLRVFIDEGKSVLDISKIAEIIAHSTTLSDKEMRVAKKQYIYNVRYGLNKSLASIFWDTESVYKVGRNGMLHFHFPEFIEEK